MKITTHLFFLLAICITSSAYAVPASQSEVITNPPEGNSNHSNYFLLEISKAIANDITFSYETRAGSATADVDYTSIAKTTGTIESGKTELLIAVEIIGDSIDENDETFSLVISDPVGASFPPGMSEITAEHTIIDDDGQSSSTTTAMAKPQVVDCSQLTTELGAQAVNKLAQYNYQKCALVAGILIANSNTSTINGMDISALTQKQADILAEILDNNQDGFIDDSTVVNYLKSGPDSGAWINIQSAANESNEDTIVEAMKPLLGRDMGVKNSWLSDGADDPGFDPVNVLIEESIHMVHMLGYARAYPEQFAVSDDGCGDNTSQGCNFNQSSLTRLAWEAMTIEPRWYHHGENSTPVNDVISGSCINPSCSAIEFLMNLLVEYRDIYAAVSEAAMPATKTAMAEKLNSTTAGQEIKAILDDSKYNQLLNGLTRSYNPQ